jgi:hypothetical protein
MDRADTVALALTEHVQSYAYRAAVSGLQQVDCQCMLDDFEFRGLAGFVESSEQGP